MQKDPCSKRFQENRNLTSEVLLTWSTSDKKSVTWQITQAFRLLPDLYVMKTAGISTSEASQTSKMTVLSIHTPGQSHELNPNGPLKKIIRVDAICRALQWASFDIIWLLTFLVAEKPYGLLWYNSKTCELMAIFHFNRYLHENGLTSLPPMAFHKLHYLRTLWEILPVAVANVFSSNYWSCHGMIPPFRCCTSETSFNRVCNNVIWKKEACTWLGKPYFPKLPRHKHAVRSDAEECVVDERLAWKHKNAPAWPKNVMHLWDFGRSPSAMYVVKNVVRTQPEDKNTQSSPWKMCVLRHPIALYINT